MAMPGRTSAAQAAIAAEESFRRVGLAGGLRGLIGNIFLKCF
tara:strand:+ start:457 stop:582 length:126 start_codon:yes stop_codon:yes gene_type:complete